MMLDGIAERGTKEVRGQWSVVSSLPLGCRQNIRNVAISAEAFFAMRVNGQAMAGGQIADAL